MALGGGLFISQNKVLPGSYVNFVSAVKASSSLSERGIVTMPLELDWGTETAVFSVSAKDFQENSLKIFGYPYGHPKMRGLRDLFCHAKMGYFYRLNGGGEKAENAFATALYGGTRGNDLKIAVRETEEALFEVLTYLEGTCVDRQVVSEAGSLVSNDFVSFKTESSLSETAGMPLSGGTNTAVDGTSYSLYLNQIEAERFHVLGCTSTDEAIKQLFVNFTRRMRDEYGVKFQTVLFRPDRPDYEGVISVENGLVADQGDASAVFWVTGAQAGCAVNRSLTNAVYTGEFEIYTAYTQQDLEAGLSEGKLLFHRVHDTVRVLEDLNSFVSFCDEKSEDFASNQTIRILDQIGNDIAALFNEKYLGRVPNDAAGRISLWNDIVRHHQELLKIRAIEEFSGEHVSVELGANKKSVVVTDFITPANCMAQLYMTVVVQ